MKWHDETMLWLEEDDKLASTYHFYHKSGKAPVPATFHPDAYLGPACVSIDPKVCLIFFFHSSVKNEILQNYTNKYTINLYST